MKPACPSEEQLKSLIIQAFDELPVPDPARMQRIATTLSRQASKRTKPRRSWLFWLLLGGSVTAMAWWAGDVLRPVKTQAPQVQNEPAKNTIHLEEKATKQQIENKTSKPERDLRINPIIDQREQY